MNRMAGLMIFLSVFVFVGEARAENISFMDIRANMEKMTDLQFDKYVKPLKGKVIRWTGWIEQVKEKFFGGYEVWIDMDSPEESFSVQDITFDVSEGIAEVLEKDGKYKFVGTIKSIHKILGSLQVNLVDVTFL